MADPATMCLALAIYFEARGEPIQGQEAVAEVVLNRASSPRYPDHVCDVVFQSRQFSFVNKNMTPAPDEDSHQWANAMRLAVSYMNGNAQRSLPRGVLWYHAQSVSPKWAESFREAATIGQHVFYSK